MHVILRIPNVYDITLKVSGNIGKSTHYLAFLLFKIWERSLVILQTKKLTRGEDLVLRRLSWFLVPITVLLCELMLWVFIVTIVTL